MNQTLQMILDEMNHELGHFPGTTLDKNAYSKFADIYYDLMREDKNRNRKARSKEKLLKLTRLLCSFADMQAATFEENNLEAIREFINDHTRPNPHIGALQSNPVDSCD